MLPQYTADKSTSAISFKFIKSYIFKMVRPHKQQMDFELALFLVVNAIKDPRKLYLHTKRLKQIRNHWHRDDPCLTAVIVGLLLLMAVLYGTFVKGVDQNEGSSIVTVIVRCFCEAVRFICGEFLLIGVILSTIFKLIAETYMIKVEKKPTLKPNVSNGGGTGGAFVKPQVQEKPNASHQNIEPMYAFDIHCNSFFPVVVFSYIVQVTSYF